MKMLVVYVVTLIVLFGVDFVWLALMGNSFYRPSMGDMALSGFRVAPGVVFYLIYTVGVVVFVIRPALAGQSLGMAAAFGVLYGLCGYAVYDLTNQATLKTWPVQLTIVDMSWGAVLTGVGSAAGYLAARFV